MRKVFYTACKFQVYYPSLFSFHWRGAFTIKVLPYFWAHGTWQQVSVFNQVHILCLSGSHLLYQCTVRAAAVAFSLPDAAKRDGWRDGKGTPFLDSVTAALTYLHRPAKPKYSQHTGPDAVSTWLYSLPPNDCATASPYDLDRPTWRPKFNLLDHNIAAGSALYA